jgi:flagellar hook assembly protein FlgD
LTHIRFDLDREQPVRLTVFSVEGKLVTTLVAGQLPAGRHEVQWDGRDARGHRMASGMYFYRLETGSDLFTRRMMLVK